MRKLRNTKHDRRDFLRTLGGVTLVAAAGSISGDARALPANYDDRRKPRYQPNSPEVQNFYRVNRYPAK